MMHRRWTAFALALGVLGGSTAALAADSPSPQVAQEKSQTFAQASGTQAGTVDNYSNNVLNLAPYNTGSDAKAFDVNSGTPIFQANGKVQTQALQKGVPVRIHYKNIQSAGQRPQVAAIEILNKEEANAAKQQSQSNPPVMMAQLGPAAGGAIGSQVSPSQKLDQAAQTQKKDLLASASGSQPGNITRIDSGKLYLDPYQKAAGESELRFDQQAPVYQGEGKVGSTALAPGTDVRVYYKNEPDQKRPKVVAVEILNPDQAKQLEKAERNVPRNQ